MILFVIKLLARIDTSFTIFPIRANVLFFSSEAMSTFTQNIAAKEGEKAKATLGRRKSAKKIVLSQETVRKLKRQLREKRDK